MRIPLPRMMRHWREREFERRLTPATVRTGLSLWAFVAKRPALYHLGTSMAIRAIRMLALGRGRLRALLFAGGWTKHRDLPVPQGRTCQEMWRTGGDE